jgi:UDP-N-acetylmuramoyl-tripeptide--D-alanyl-D-alanine ligase
VFTVSPGMVELGHQQYTRNEAFAASATARPNMTLAVVARTNRKALEAGARGPGELRRYPDRKAATAAIMSEARAGDVVLYENDLPDHYP